MHITQDVSNLIQVALDEDIPTYDVTTRGLFPQSSLGTARIVSKENGVLAGMSVAFNVCKLVDPKLEYNTQFLTTFEWCCYLNSKLCRCS